MAATITREQINSRSSADGGTVPSGLFIRDVPDFIQYVERDDTPLVKKIPTASAGNMLKHEHGQGYLMPQTVTSTVARVAGDTTVTLSNANLVQQYDVLYNVTTGERMYVRSAPGVNPVTIERGYGSTTPAAIALNEVLVIVGPAVPEGADSPRSPSIAGDLDWDTYQIFEYTWEVTHRGRVTPDYEYKSDRFKAELKRKMVEATRDLENVALHGIRYLPANKTDGTMTRGMIQAMTANATDMATDPLTLAAFLDNQQTVFNDVGPNDMGKTIILSAYDKRIFNSFINPIRQGTATDATLNLTLDTINTDFGQYKFLVHYNMPRGRIVILNFQDIVRKPYEGGNWTSGMFSTNGWYDRGFLRGDFGFMWPVARRRSSLFNYSITAADYPNLDMV